MPLPTHRFIFPLVWIVAGKRVGFCIIPRPEFLLFSLLALWNWLITQCAFFLLGPTAMAKTHTPQATAMTRYGTSALVSVRVVLARAESGPSRACASFYPFSSRAFFVFVIYDYNKTKAVIIVYNKVIIMHITIIVLRKRINITFK